MSSLPEAFEQLRRKNSGALALAERAALAAWVEPELLRALRLETLPGVEAAAEADLWFSELVSAHSTRAVVLRAEYLEPLREWARTAPPEELLLPVEVIRRMHAGSSELILREERIIAGAMAGTLSPQDIQQQLFEILATLIEDPNPARRDAVASWALGAWPRLPREVRHSSAGLQLLVAANQRRGGYLAGPSIELPDETLESFYAGLLGAQVRPAYVEVAWLGKELVLRQVQVPGPVTVEVSGTMPVVLEIHSAQRRSLVMLHAQEPARMNVERDALTLRTMDGRSYRVAKAPSVYMLDTQVVAPGPWHWSKKWISVVGTGVPELPEKVRQIAAVLGQGLAREGHGLVAGDWPGVDGMVANSYTEELVRLGGDPRVFLARDLAGAGGALDGSAARRRRYPQYKDAAYQADALVLLGGDVIARSVFLAARDMGRPVLPLPATGGSAAYAFASLLKSAEREDSGSADLQRLDVPLESTEEIQHASTVVLALLQQVPGRIEPYARAMLLLMASVWRAGPGGSPASTALVQQLVRQNGLRPQTPDELPPLFESLLMAEPWERALEVALTRISESLPAMKARLLHDFHELGELGEFGLRIQARLARLVVASHGRAGVETVGRAIPHHSFAHPALLMLAEGARQGFASEEQFRAWVSENAGLSWTELSFRALIEDLAAGPNLEDGMEQIRAYYGKNRGRPAPDHARYYLTIQLPPNQRALAYFVAREFHLVELRDQLFSLLPFEQNEFLSLKSAQPLEQLLEALNALGAAEHLRDPADGRRRVLQELLEALGREPDRDPDGRIRKGCLQLLGGAPKEPRMELAQALLAAFPNQVALSRMVRMTLNRDLKVIATGSLLEQVYRLIEYAEAEGRLEELVVKASEANPSSPDLKAFSNSYLQSASIESGNQVSRQTVDIGIILAFPDEFRTFAELVPTTPTARRDPGTGRVDYTFQTPDGRYQGAVTSVNKMGEVAAALTAEQFSLRWKPRLTVLLGHAMGIDPRLSVGDVVIANRVFRGMEPVRNVSNEAPSISVSAGPVYHTDHQLIGYARNFEFSQPSLFHRWRTACANNLVEFLPDPKERTTLLLEGIFRAAPEFHDIGLLSVGRAVRHDFSRLVDTMRDIGAVDMESTSLIAAAETHRPELRRTLILRGISDLGDERQQKLSALPADPLRTYALRNTIALLWALLQGNFLDPSDPEEFVKA